MVVNNSGCGEVMVFFVNNVFFNGVEGFFYFWFFGNGNFMIEENFVDQIYN